MFCQVILLRIPCFISNLSLDLLVFIYFYMSLRACNVFLLSSFLILQKRISYCSLIGSSP
jgi:hypothetical protein